MLSWCCCCGHDIIPYAYGHGGRKKHELSRAPSHTLRRVAPFVRTQLVPRQVRGAKPLLTGRALAHHRLAIHAGPFRLQKIDLRPKPASLEPTRSPRPRTATVATTILASHPRRDVQFCCGHVSGAYHGTDHQAHFKVRRSDRAIA